MSWLNPVSDDRPIEWKCPLPYKPGKRIVHNWGPEGYLACRYKWDGIGMRCDNPKHWTYVDEPKAGLGEAAEHPIQARMKDEEF